MRRPSGNGPTGSTANTACPIDANAAASRPMPAPTSRMREGVSGIRCRTGRWWSSNEILRQSLAKTSACLA